MQDVSPYNLHVDEQRMALSYLCSIDIQPGPLASSSSSSTNNNNDKQPPSSVSGSSPTTITTSTTASSSLEERVTALERAHYQCPSYVVSLDDAVRRARTAVETAQVYSAVWRWVPPDYYTYPLTQRAQCLQANNVSFLCKSLLLENKKAISTQNDPTNPRFVLVVLQYAAALSVRKLTTAVRGLRPVTQRLDVSKFDFRIASTEDNDRLTGYAHNSVTPFGLQAAVPIVLTEEVTKLQFLWMGGGHVHLKLGLSVADFIRALQPLLVADISDPRADDGDNNLDDY